MDQSKFSFSACVDWVEVVVSLQVATNPHTIRRHFPGSWVGDEGVAPYVHPLQGTSNNTTAQVFRFRVQEPKSATDFQLRLDQFATTFPFSEPPKITGVEIALDCRSKALNFDELVDMADHFKFAHSRFSDWRLTGPNSPPIFEINANRRQFKTGLAEGCSLNSGHEGDPIRQRVYVKTTDNSGRTSLSPSDHRARIEVTLTGDALPFTNIEEWQRYRFEVLAKPYISFVKPKDNLAPCIMSTIKNVSRTRLVLDWSTIKNRRKKSPALQADSPLNAAAFDALRRLTRRQQKVTLNRPDF